MNHFYILQGEIYFELMLNKPKSECIHHFPIDLELYGVPFGSKSTGKTVNTIGFQLI